MHCQDQYTGYEQTGSFNYTMKCNRMLHFAFNVSAIYNYMLHIVVSFRLQLKIQAL